MEHTPGPWEFHEHGDREPVEFMIYRGTWNSIERDIASTHGYSAQEEADARLIAAAPELLEALQFVMKNGHFDECIPGQRGEVPDDERCSHVCTLFRKAIAKATGA